MQHPSPSSNLNPHADRILVLDFGSQYTQLIARRVREARVYCEIQPFDMPEEDILEFAPRGIILSGGPESVTLSQTPRVPQAVFDLGVPVLGISWNSESDPSQFSHLFPLLCF